jgi:3-oxoacyl-[acyl-carrier-protein] synthase II
VAGGASSLLAVIEAASAIRRGHADVMLAGGSGAVSSFSCLPFRGWEQLSKWQGDPAGACRPFERRRSGLVLGEGAGALLLETRELAERRGAKILGRVAGFASRFEPPGDPYKPRTGRAIRQSIQAALAAAELTPNEIGHVNSHGEGSVVEDRIEAEAIRDTLGDVPVTALKSYFGDLGAGSGAVELIGSVLALMHGRVPPTLNYEEADPACPVNVIHGKGQPIGKPAAMALNQSNTGQAAAVVISKD